MFGQNQANGKTKHGLTTSTQHQNPPNMVHPKSRLPFCSTRVTESLEAAALAGEVGITPTHWKPKLPAAPYAAGTSDKSSARSPAPFSRLKLAPCVPGLRLESLLGGCLDHVSGKSKFLDLYWPIHLSEEIPWFQTSPPEVANVKVPYLARRC